MNHVESLIEFVKGSKLPDDVKEVLVDRLTMEGLTTDVVDTLKEAFQDELDLAFKEAGVALDPNDPEVSARLDKFEAALAAAQAEAEQEAAQLEAQMSHSIADIQTGADETRADQIRNTLP